MPVGRIVASVVAGGGGQLSVLNPAHNDFNGDGLSDILWRNDDGTVRDWLGQSDGSFATNVAHVDVDPGKTWHVQDSFVDDPFVQLVAKRGKSSRRAGTRRLEIAWSGVHQLSAANDKRSLSSGPSNDRRLQMRVGKTDK